MPRPASPEVRTALVERAAEMLARREEVTLRALVAGTGTSTMAVYTHFGGLSGLWRAVRQEGFSRLADRLGQIQLTDDPVQDLAALGAGYTQNALANPHLYRAMFDTAAELEDPEAAGTTFLLLNTCAARAVEQGRFAGPTDASALATQFWAGGHGLIMLVLTGVLATESLDVHAPALAYALFVAAGDEPVRCRDSVETGWGEGARPVRAEP